MLLLGSGWEQYCWRGQAHVVNIVPEVRGNFDAQRRRVNSERQRCVGVVGWRCGGGDAGEERELAGESLAVSCPPHVHPCPAHG